MIAAGPTGEVALSSWSAGVWCAPHDHGVAGTLVLILEGSFIERRYAFRDGALWETGDRPLAPGQTTRLASGEVHAMLATESGRTLHLYAPYPGPMRVYDAAGKRTLTLAETAGAWLPADPEQVLAVAPWNMG